MKATILLLPLIILSVLLAGCAQQQEETMTVTGTVNEGAAPMTSVSVENQPQQARMEEQEVRLTKDGFFPHAYTLSAGETLRLTFMFKEPHFLAIDGIGFAQEVYHTTLDLDFPAPGTYDLVCMDCEDKPTATISVQ